MSHVISGAGGIDANLAPDAFHWWAAHYYKCKQDFRAPDDRFSPVPYFLLCRAIELEVKSRHLRSLTQQQVKVRFGHDLSRAYAALDSREKVLNPSELRTLVAASGIYAGKGFEYFEPEDAATAYSRYPSLDELDSIAKRLIGA